MRVDPSLGCHGGKVLRQIISGDVTIPAGTVLSGAVVSQWPHRNRVALHNTRKIEFFAPPAPADADKAPVVRPRKAS